MECLKKRSSERSSTAWQFYRPRSRVKARRLTKPLVFVDVFGHEHRGNTGDYLVEWSDGMFRIAPRELIEENYIRLGPAKPSPLVQLIHSSCRPQPQGPSPNAGVMLGREEEDGRTVEKDPNSSAARPLIA
jgi:hypothetical protein